MVTVNDIYDSVEAKVNTAAHPVYCSSVREPIAEDLPACRIYCISQLRDRVSVDLSFADKQKRFTFEVQTFSDLADEGMTEANTIMDYAESAFNDIKFLCTFRQEIDNIDPTIKRVAARFERVIGDSDTI